MTFCCDMMEYHHQVVDCFADRIPNKIICFNPKFNEYGIKYDAISHIEINFCPWCGKKLPESLRERWHEELEKIGCDPSNNIDIPDKFKTDAWWK